MRLSEFLRDAFEYWEGTEMYLHTVIEASFEATTVRFKGILLASIDHSAKQVSFFCENYSISTRRRVEILQKIARKRHYALKT